MFAAIHVAVALPILASLEANDATMLREMNSHRAFVASNPRIVRVIWMQETEIAFDMCGMIDEIPAQERILVFADLPSFFLTASRMACPPRWSVSGILLGTTWQPPNSTRLVKQRIVDGVQLLLIALQWLLIGGFPLRPDKSLRHDPAAIVTICTVAATSISYIPKMDFFSGLFMLIALCFWLYWLALLLWGLTRSIRKRTAAA